MNKLPDDCNECRMSRYYKRGVSICCEYEISSMASHGLDHIIPVFYILALS